MAEPETKPEDSTESENNNTNPMQQFAEFIANAINNNDSDELNENQQKIYNLKFNWKQDENHLNACGIRLNMLTGMAKNEGISDQRYQELCEELITNFRLTGRPDAWNVAFYPEVPKT